MSYNINSAVKVIKTDDNNTSPYKIGGFFDEIQDDLDNNINTQLNNLDAQEELHEDKIVDIIQNNLSFDPVLEQIDIISKSVDTISQKITNLENNSTNTQKLDDRIVQSLKDLQQYALFFEKATLQIESKMLNTSISIAKKIIGINIDQNSALIAEQTIRNILDKIKKASKVTIYLNPQDYVSLKDNLELPSFIHIEEDSNVALAGVIISSDLGNFDGNIDAKIDNMIDSLQSIQN